MNDSPSHSQTRAPDEGEHPPHPELGTAYLPDSDAQSISQRWNAIQAAFVDDPKNSVAKAHQLVGELTDRIVDQFTRERGALEQQWSSGGEVSTETLRVCLQRYRAFFNRLVPTLTKATSH